MGQVAHAQLATLERVQHPQAPRVREHLDGVRQAPTLAFRRQIRPSRCGPWTIDAVDFTESFADLALFFVPVLASSFHESAGWLRC